MSAYENAHEREVRLIIEEAICRGEERLLRVSMRNVVEQLYWRLGCERGTVRHMVERVLAEQAARYLRVFEEPAGEPEQLRASLASMQEHYEQLLWRQGMERRATEMRRAMLAQRARVDVALGQEEARS